MGAANRRLKQASRPTTRAIPPGEITMHRPKAVGNTTTQHLPGRRAHLLEKEPHTKQQRQTIHCQLASYHPPPTKLPTAQLPTVQRSNGPTVQLPATKSQAPTAHHQPPATSVQEPSTNCPPPHTSTNSYQPRATTTYDLNTASYTSRHRTSTNDF